MTGNPARRPPWPAWTVAGGQDDTGRAHPQRGGPLSVPGARPLPVPGPGADDHPGTAGRAVPGARSAGTPVAGRPVAGRAGRPLAGRRALVAGGMRAEGRAIALALAEAGAAVAVADDAGRTGLPPGARPLPGGYGGPLSGTARRLSQLGAVALAIHCDLASEADCQGAPAYAALEFGALDILVVCAGALRREPSSALWLVRAARAFLADGAAVVLPGPGDRSPESGGTSDGPPELPGPLDAALSRRGTRVHRVAAGAGDTLGDIASAYVDAAGGGGRRGGGGARPAPGVPGARI
ncbi:hypothetical protein ACFOVU_28025 [Nocardiopsis sediminis]|uniref:SDR family NAD(P)-dependent oxidoreductase n=1 Tax=Nocardiopsis sediminis TaxID=1778267 RepID=A0ABV8FWE9_9ACTN